MPSCLSMAFYGVPIMRPESVVRIESGLPESPPLDLDRMEAAARARLEAFVNRRAYEHKRALFAISFTARLFKAWLEEVEQLGLLGSAAATQQSNPFPQPEAIERFYGR